MKSKKYKKTSYLIGILSLGATMLSLQVAQAWTEPTVDPPGGNVDAPINTGAVIQNKIGGLGVTGLFNATGPISSSIITGLVNGDVAGQRLCIGTDCRSVWPGGGSSQWTTSGSNIYYNGGSVGIGTATPGAKLEVAFPSGNTGYVQVNNVSSQLQMGVTNSAGYINSNDDLDIRTGTATVATARNANFNLKINSNFASVNYGSLSIGGPDSRTFDGSTAGHFTGVAGGTSLAVDEPSAFAGNLLDLQKAGSSKFTVSAAGDTNVSGKLTAAQGTGVCAWRGTVGQGGTVSTTCNTNEFVNGVQVEDTSGDIMHLQVFCCQL